MLATPPQTAADLRAAIGRARVRIYRLAPLVNLHPSQLSLILNERKQLLPDVAERLARAIQEEASRS